MIFNALWIADWHWGKFHSLNEPFKIIYSFLKIIC